MIVARMIGGPRDGEQIALPLPIPLQIPVYEGLDYHVIKILPVRDIDGEWLLYWPREES